MYMNTPVKPKIRFSTFAKVTVALLKAQAGVREKLTAENAAVNKAAANCIQGGQIAAKFRETPPLEASSINQNLQTLRDAKSPNAQQALSAFKGRADQVNHEISQVTGASETLKTNFEKQIFPDQLKQTVTLVENVANSPNPDETAGSQTIQNQLAQGASQFQQIAKEQDRLEKMRDKVQATQKKLENEIVANPIVAANLAVKSLGYAEVTRATPQPGSE